MADIEKLISKQALEDATTNLEKGLLKSAEALDKLIEKSKVLNSQLEKNGITQKELDKIRKEIAANQKKTASEADKIRKAEEAAEKKRLAALEKETVAYQKELLARQNRIKAAKEEATAEKAKQDATSKTIGTLERLTAQNKVLRAEQKKLNLETEEGVTRNKEIITQIDKNTETIKENSDAFTRNKINVGNYTGSIVEAYKEIKKLESNNKSLISQQKKLDVRTDAGRSEFKRLENQIKQNITQVNIYNNSIRQNLSIQNIFSKGIKGLQSAFFAVTGAVAAASVAIRIGREVIDSTQSSGDALAVTMGGIKAGWDAAKKSIATGSTLPELIQNIKDAVEVGEEYIKILDDLGDRQRSLTLSEKAAAKETEQLKQIVDNVNLSNEERLEAADKIFKIESDLAKKRTSIANQELEAETSRLEVLTGLNKQQVLDFIKNYDEQKEIREQAIAFIEKEDDLNRKLANARRATNQTEAAFNAKIAASAQKELSTLLSTTDKSVQTFAEIQRAYGKTTDEELDKVVVAYGKVVDADIAYSRQTRRVANQRNTLLKQISKEEVEIVEETESKKVDTRRAADEQSLRDAQRAADQRLQIKGAETFKQADLDKSLTSFTDNLYETETAKFKANEEEKTRIAEAEENKRKLFKEAAFQAGETVVRGIADSAFDAGRERREQELADIDAKVKAGVLSEAEADRQRKKIQKEQAKADKRKALFDIFLATAIAVTKAGLITPTAIAAGIVGAAQLAVVAAKPLPKFAKGTGGEFSTPDDYIAGEAGEEIKIDRFGNATLVKKATRFTGKQHANNMIIPNAQTKSLLNGNFDKTSFNDQRLLEKLEQIYRKKQVQSPGITEAGFINGSKHVDALRARRNRFIS